MKPKIKLILISVAVVGLRISPCGFAEDIDELKVGREHLMEQLSKNIKISKRGVPGLNVDEQEQLLSQVTSEMKDAVQLVCPETLTASSQDRLKQLLSSGLTVSESDMEYNRALVLEWVKGINLSFKFEKLVSPLPADQLEAVKANVVALRQGMQDRMTAYLADYVSSEEISKYLDLAQISILEKLDSSPLSYGFRIPLKPQELESLVREFDERLKESVSRVDKRFARAERIKDETNRTKYIMGLKSSILNETASRTFSILGKRTSDPELAKMDPDSFEPGYTEAVRKRTEIQRKLVDKKRQQELHELENRKREEVEHIVQETQNELTPAVIDSSISCFATTGPDNSEKRTEEEASAPSIPVAVSEGTTQRYPTVPNPSHSSAVIPWSVFGLFSLAVCVTVVWRRAGFVRKHQKSSSDR